MSKIKCFYGQRHKWLRTLSVVGGCRENPGFQSLGGLRYLAQEHCPSCGAQRETFIDDGAKVREVRVNPGVYDTAEKYVGTKLSLSPIDGAPGFADGHLWGQCWLQLEGEPALLLYQREEVLLRFGNWGLLKKHVKMAQVKLRQIDERYEAMDPMKAEENF